jgi:hypothetical protein
MKKNKNVGSKSSFSEKKKKMGRKKYTQADVSPENGLKLSGDESMLNNVDSSNFLFNEDAAPVKVRSKYTRQTLVCYDSR